MSRRSEPSQRQQQIAETVREHGSVEAAATSLGISRVTVETTLARYHTAVCDHRIEHLEAEVAILRERDRVATTAQRLEVLVGRVERALQPVSHRRLADGGTRVTEQRRERPTASGSHAGARIKSGNDLRRGGPQDSIRP